MQIAIHIKKFPGWLLWLTIISVSACGRTNTKRHFAEIMQPVDKVELQFFNNGDTLRQSITNPKNLMVYKELITGTNNDTLRCDSTGRIRYFTNNKWVLDAYFSFGNGSGLAYYFEGYLYRSPFTYRVGMSLDYYMSELTTKH